MAWHQKLQDRAYHSCRIRFLITLSEPLLHSWSKKKGTLCVWNMCDWQRKRDNQRQTEDLAFGLCTVYSSGGCTFLRPDHMTGGMGVCVRESGSNHCWAKLTLRSDGGVEPSSVTDYLCVAFPSSDKRPCRHEQRAAGPDLILCWSIKGFGDGEINEKHWILIVMANNQRSLSRSLLEVHFADWVQRAVWTGLSRPVPWLDRKQEVAEEETSIKRALDRRGGGWGRATTNSPDKLHSMHTQTQNLPYSWRTSEQNIQLQCAFLRLTGIY